MDVDTRHNTRFRGQSHLHKGMNGGQEDSGGESESNLVRRKFQRTTTDPSETDDTFRKPSIPASATRPAGLEHRPSLSQRRRSTLRENVRVPSGPREFPSPSKQRLASNSTNAPSINDTTNSSRTFLPHSSSESFIYNIRTAGAASMSRERLNYGNPTDTAESPTTPASRSNGAKNFDFLPDINFDDFQTSIKHYDGTSPMLSEFPDVDGGRILPGEESYNSMARVNGYGSGNRQKEQLQEQQGMSRTQSLRQRLGAGRQASGQQNGSKDAAAEPKPSSLRNRRQSTAPQSNAAQTSTITPAASKPPRKSVGPGLITSMMKGNEQRNVNGDAQQKSSLARTSSLSKARRTTIQPSALPGAEVPRTSTLTATTQSRQNKVKSLQPPPKAQDEPVGTPSSVKSGKSGQTRAHTPSSGSGRRQSMASGRASGLGARTISPTDARRLKRMSMNPPPMPTAYLGSKSQPSPQEEIQNPMNNVPRMAQPSPSLIPRKTSNATPSSARESPEGKIYSSGGVSLASKSSFSSLVNAPANANGSSSRLPTPKPRTGNQSSSSLGQYNDRHYGEGDYSELVPPVPQIPKAFESPQDEDHRPFFSSLRSQQSTGPDNAASTGWTEVSALPPPQRISQTPRGSLDIPAETPRKRSGEFPRHRRTNTGGSGVQVPAMPVPPMTASRAQPDPNNGRKNANLQPLRLPPMNLMPMGIRTLHSTNNAPALPRPSQETDYRDPTDWSVQTPEPKRVAKTPTTPMTASKATFFRRQDEKAALRSSSSHYALRDVMGMDVNGNMTTRYWDDSDAETASQGVPIPNNKQPRSAITPFASGSLPKQSAEFAKQMRSRPSGEYDEDPYSLGNFEGLQWQNARPPVARHRTGTQTTIGSMSVKSPLDIESPSVLEPPSLPEPKKEGSAEKKEGGGLRRKLSLGWRRASSKAADHAENKSSPQENGEKHEKSSRLQKRGSEMPPPKLPASVTWSGDVPSLPSTARASFEQNSMLGHARRKSQLPASVSQVSIPSDSDNTSGSGHMGGVKTRALHSEQPTPVTSSTRASSWGNLGANSRNAPQKNARHKFTSSGLSAIVKDKDDYAADDEMARLSRKRKDVDSAARESEEIKKRAVARQPVPAESVLHDRSLTGGSQLNVFERGEIVDYEKEGIYFTGTRSARKIIGSLSPSSQLGKDAGKDAGGTNNFGYDDERGDYNIVMGDHLSYRYEVVDVLGKGSFGQVVRCVDHKEGGVVAVKIIRNKKRFHQQALVEVGILGRLREWDPEGTHATLSITSSFYFRSHLCIVTPCLSINLYELIRAHNFTGFNIALIRRFSRQLLATLVLLQSKRIIHCDLKPENILLCEARKADVRVIDFGSSCREEEKVYTYIQSRFYRSPEVILGSSYGLGIDMWSFGCILAELWTGYPIFPGENEQEQLACIMEIFGPPDRHLVERCTRKKLFFDSVGKPRVTVSSKGRRRRPSSKTLQQALKSDDDAFLDFITRCLRWDPERRLKPHEAVNHPFITNQPLSQRSQGIPDEARRAARVRSTAAVPTTSAAVNGSIPSPVKRGNAFAGQQQTPAKEKAPRQLPEAPQTALRNGGMPSASMAAGNTAHGSPSKSSAAVGGNRRHSTINTAGAAAVAGSKRASNGAVLAGGALPPVGSGGIGSFAGVQRLPGGNVAPSTQNLAQMAAAQSMGVSSAGVGGSGRWKA